MPHTRGERSKAGDGGDMPPSVGVGGGGVGLFNPGFAGPHSGALNSADRWEGT